MNKGYCYPIVLNTTYVRLRIAGIFKTVLLSHNQSSDFSDRKACAFEPNTMILWSEHSKFQDFSAIFCFNMDYVNATGHFLAIIIP